MLMLPARFARLLLTALFRRLLPPEEEGAVLGDLEEGYADRVKREGRAAAERWTCGQILRSLGPTLRRRIWRARRGFVGPGRGSRGHGERGRRGGGTMESLAKDIRYAVRGLLRKPAYLAIAVLTLGIGIGGTSALWSVVRTTLLAPLPYEDDSELVWFWQEFSWNAPEILLLRGQWDGFDGVAGFTQREVTFRLPEGRTSQFRGIEVSTEMFDVLGRAPALGRTFEEGEDLPDAAPVVVLSHALWQTELGGDPGVLGSPVVVDGATRTVVGVMPEDFYFPDRTARLWTPGPLVETNYSGRWTMIGRLPDGREPTDMRPVLDRVATVLGENFQYGSPEWDRTRNATLTPLRERLIGDVGQALLLTLAAVGLVLAMACANVGALALARTHARRQELAIRVALGAGRGRLARAFLVETLLVGLLAGTAGALFALGTFRGIVYTLPLTAELSAGLAADGSILAAAFVLSLLVAVAIGIISGWTVMCGGTPRLGTARTVLRTIRLERALVVVEMAIAVVLVTGAGLMIRSVQELQRLDAGFEPDGLLDVRLTMGGADFDAETRTAFLEQLAERVAALPGVESVANTQAPPLAGGSWNFGVAVEGREEDIPATTLYRLVGANYFRATGTDVVRGRGFESTDRRDTELVTLVNRAFADRFFAGEDPLGRRLENGIGEGWVTIVGIVENEALAGLRSIDRPAQYVLGRQYPWAAESNSLLVRADRVEAATLIPAVRASIESFDSRIAVAHLEPMSRSYRRNLGRTGQLVVLLGGLGTLGLVLGGVGVYGVVNQFVVRRNREWGLRLALGQSPAGIQRHVLVGAAGLIGAGICVGLVCSWMGSRALGSLLYGVPPTDVWAFGGAALVLSGAGVLAALLPARRAARVDPVESLHTE